MFFPSVFYACFFVLSRSRRSLNARVSVGGSVGKGVWQAAAAALSSALVGVSVEHAPDRGHSRSATGSFRHRRASRSGANMLSVASRREENEAVVLDAEDGDDDDLAEGLAQPSCQLVVGRISVVRRVALHC